jgi:hypothetical protein
MNLKRLATQGHGLGRTGQETNATPLASRLTNTAALAA